MHFITLFLLVVFIVLEILDVIALAKSGEDLKIEIVAKFSIVTLLTAAIIKTVLPLYILIPILIFLIVLMAEEVRDNFKKN